MNASLLAAVLVLAACQGVSRDWPRFAPADGALPARARVVELDEFERLFDSGLLRPMDPEMEAPSPHTASLRESLSTSPVPLNQRALDLSSRRAMADSAREMFNRRDNHALWYRQTYLSLPPELQARYPSPEKVATLGPAEAAAQARVLLGVQAEVERQTTVAEPVLAPRPDAEIGAGARASDRTGYGTACETHHPAGLYANADWPLKRFTTSVKDQGERGSCAAFAVVGAVEAFVAARDHSFVNLSEQHLYAQAGVFWWFKNYGEGTNPLAFWRQSAATEYRIPYEQAWDYNPSLARETLKAERTYSHSCDGYFEDEYCSDTVHQAGVVCARDPRANALYCGYAVQENRDQSGYRVREASELLDFSALDDSIAKARLSLTLRNPVIMAVDMTAGFAHPDSSGFVPYTEGEDDSLGGHVALVTGFVANEKLPESVPPGAGGGYFVVKNSWGLCKGDAGYLYLTVQWVKAHAWSITVLTDLE